MPLQALLLLILLGLGSSLQLPETWEDGAEEASDYLLARSRRQVISDKQWDTYDGYDVTDPPEMLENDVTGTVALIPRSHGAVMRMLGQKGSAGPGISEPTTLGTARGHATGLGAGVATIENLSVDLATEGIPITPGPLPKELVTSIPPVTEAPSTELVTMKPLSTGPAATEALTTQPAATEALSTRPAATEALTTQPAATEVLSTRPAAMEALTIQPAATEALSTRPAATEALTTQPAAPGTLSKEPGARASFSMEPTTTETLPKDPATMKALSTQPDTTWGLTTALLMSSDPHRSTTMAVSSSSDDFIKQQKNSQSLSPWSSVSPSSTRMGLDSIPVKHCLLAILILALVATTFLVCTVVLAIRLSRKNHMYPVRSYSPTEMVCISSLLPEGYEGPAATNGSLPAAKKPSLKDGPKENLDGDDLTLRSFLP